jgi:hypothetical protein
MNVFFSKNHVNRILYNSFTKNYSRLHLKDTVYIKYYDQFKYLHSLEGKCLRNRITKSGDSFISIHSKLKNFKFSFFKQSPLIVSVIKKNV